MIPRPLQIDSTAELPPLTWRDVKFGYSQRLLGWKSVVELATSSVTKGCAGALQVELASIGKDETWRVSELLEQLAAAEEGHDDVEIKKKWLFIVLSWLYQNKDQFEDPLQEVEVVYADFGYPDEISQFVRFLPPRNDYRPPEHSLKENIQRIYDHWREYLSTRRDLYFKSRQLCE